MTDQLEFNETEEIVSIIPDVKLIIEALLFSASTPLSTGKIHSVLKDDFSLSKKDLTKILLDMKDSYEQEERAFELVSIADGYLLKTRSKFYPWLKQLYKGVAHERLSRPALETLSIIAYKQPISRAEIEGIRGVNVDGVMRVLLDKGMIYASGRKDVPGKPWLYSTTKNFLTSFGLKNIQDLPALGEINRN